MSRSNDVIKQRVFRMLALRADYASGGKPRPTAGRLLAVVSFRVLTV